MPIGGATGYSSRKREGLKATNMHGRNGVVEMHAVQLAYPCAQHIARVTDGDGPAEDYRCACELAQMVGIDLEDG